MVSHNARWANLRKAMNSGMNMSDWRLQGQEFYLKQASMRFCKWRPRSAVWDHDHCEFCGRKFSQAPPDLKEGYVTLNNYHWVCVDCFADFKDRFAWVLVVGP